MADLLSLKQKFANLLLGEHAIRIHEDMLNEGVYGAVAKLPYVIGSDDKQFLDQFDPEYWKSAIDERFNILYNELQKVNKIRDPLFKSAFRKYYSQELSKINKDHHQTLDTHTKKHLAERHAYVKAKAEAATQSRKFLPQKDLGLHNFVLTTGKGQTKTVKALPFIYGPQGLLNKLEGTPGVMNGHDLSNPREVQAVDEDSGKVITKKMTDGFVFPQAEQIQDRIDDHLKHMADGLIMPVTSEEAAAYSPANRANFKPVKTSRGYLRDTKSKDFYISEFKKRFKQQEDQNPATPEPEKNENAKRKAILAFANLVNAGRLQYSNGNPMANAEIIYKNQQPVGVDLGSDSAKDKDGIPVNAIRLPHKEVVINGEKKEVPVMLSGMPFKRIDDDNERASNRGMEIGRDYFNPITGRVEKLFRRLNNHEMRDSYQGKKGYILSGSVDPNRMSPETMFLPNIDPKYADISKVIMTHVYRMYRNRHMSFTEFVRHVVDLWLAASCEMDRRDLCVEKMILSHHKSNLYSLAEMKVMNNLNNPDIFDQRGNLVEEELRNSIVADLNRFLQQDLGRGTRKNRHNTLKSRREAVRCEIRMGQAGQCVYNYDIYKFVQEFITNELHLSKQRPAKNIFDLRSEIAEEINGKYAMLDLIHLLYEELDKGKAEQASKDLRERAFQLSKDDFVKECEKEVGAILKKLNTKVKDAKKKVVLQKFGDLFATHQLGKLEELLAQLTGTSAATLRKPAEIREPEESAAELAATPAAPENKVQNAVESYESQMQDNPRLADIGVIDSLTSGFNKAEKKQFMDSISPVRVAMKEKIHTADRSIRAIAKKPLINVGDIPFSLLSQFFDQDGNDDRLRHASKPMLEELLKFVQQCHKIVSLNPRDRPRILRFAARIDRVKKAINDRS